MPSFEPTEEQQAILNHPLGKHARILAGPGTGKSATSVALAERLLGASNPAPRIKFLTFTRAATAELAKKIGDSGVAVGRPSTMHSFSIATLLQNPGCVLFPAPLRIPDDHEFHTIVRSQLAQRMGVSVQRIRELIAEMSAKWDSLEDHPNPNVTEDERRRFIAVWMEHRRIFGYTLTHELPDLFRNALLRHDDLVGLGYDAIIVDEYQDLNACDLEVLRLLSARGAAIISVGDEDQSIYSFRKAHPQGIIRFLEDYQTPHDYRLTLCRRCGSSILGWAQYVIQGDPSNPSLKTLRPMDGPVSGTSKLLHFRSDVGEAKGITKIIQWLAAQGVPYDQILVLSRSDHNGTFTAPLKAKLSELGIPVLDPECVNLMLESPDNRLLLCVLRLLDEPHDSLAWCSLLNAQSGIGPTFIRHICGKAVAANATFGSTFVSEAANGLLDAPAVGRARAAAMWSRINGMLQSCAVPEGDSTQWGEWIIQEVDAGRLPPCTPDLRSLLLEIDGVMEEKVNLRRYLAQLQPLGRDLMNTKANGVRFMTMTSSKGLTVKATIVVGVDNDLIPRQNADRAEERRLLYVAMTRSTDYLYMTWATRRRGPGARAGRANIGHLRQPCEFLDHGPVHTVSGDEFVATLAIPSESSDQAMASARTPD